MDELNRYRMDVVALQEVRWPYEGKMCIKDYQLYYSGNDIGRMQRGVAIAIRKRLDSAVVSFEAINDRMCMMRLKGRFKNLSIVCFYAPTEDAEDEKDLFYETLEQLWSRIPGHDVKILLGDANAKIGKEEVWNSVAGKESIHTDSNNNGLRLLNLAVASNMKVVSTSFPRKDIHKVTWISPSGLTSNQIDHVLIDSRHRSNITNVRTIRGAECGSDHYLILVKIYQRLAIEKRSNTRQHSQIETNNLNDSIKANRFRTQLANKLNDLDISKAVDIHTKWKEIQKTVQESSKEVCEIKEKKSWKTLV